MQSRAVQMVELVQQGRWKVEFFVSDSNGSKSTAFPLVALRELLVERKETLDPQQHADHIFNYLGLEHVQSVTGDLIDAYRPRCGAEVLSRCKVFRSGDLLYGRLRPSLNKVFVATEETVEEGICSGEFYVMTSDTKRLLPRFTRELLASSYIQDVVKGMTTGSALPRLQLDDLLDIEVPIPSLEVQRKYERELKERIKRRRSIAAELGCGPSKQLEALVTWLETGEEPSVEPESETAASFRMHKLPDAAVSAGRRRGRPTVSLFDGA